MNRTLIPLAAIAFCLSAPIARSAEPLRDYPIHPVPARQVRFADMFWAPRLEVNRTATIPFSFQRCEETGRIENFKVAAHQSDAKWTGMAGFNDSDVYKVMEGAADSLMTHPDAKLAAYLDRLVGWVAAAQEEDGYLYTEWTARDRIAQPNPIKCCIPRNEKKWLSEKDSHELYNMGHMLEAAVAHWEATGEKTFLNVAKKNADLLAGTFGPGKMELPSGHPEIELALVKLYRATADAQYLELAKFFVGVRGRTTKERPQLWGEYAQDQRPLVDQQKAVGHAVRAMYLYAAATDIAALTGDAALEAAVDRLWNNVVGQKTYITGAIGAASEGEAFGKDYDLPNDKAYAETCANLSTCFWNHRMFLLHGDAKYIDTLEQALYNSAISGVALDGKTFFYPNPLSSTGDHERRKWFDCACCPTNICRFIPSIPGYSYATQGNTIYVNLFAAGSANVDLAGGKVRIEQQTNYPWDGQVSISLRPERFKPDEKIALRIRVPGWARGQAFASDLYRFADDSPAQYSVKLNGESLKAPLEKGYITINRSWKPTDTVTLNLPMTVHRVVANEKVAADRDRVALMRGPIVFCVEWPDVKDGKVHDLALADATSLATEFRKDLLGGVQTIQGNALRPLSSETSVAKGSPKDGEFELVTVNTHEITSFTAIPYYAWANRGPGQMAVWLKRAP
jgi:DUF1680 family protein